MLQCNHISRKEDDYLNEFIKLLDPKYELESYKIKNSTIVFSIKSNDKELTCPFCGQKSKRIHSRYQREIQDLPIQDKQAILLVDTRKMFCDNRECTHKTFSERHPFASSNGKKTVRLEKNIIHTAAQLSSLNSSRLLKSENIKVCKSSICSLLKKNAINCASISSTAKTAGSR